MKVKNTKIIFWTRQIWWPPSFSTFDYENSIRVLEYAYNSWIKIFDTAPIYWDWKSEEVIGDFLVKNNCREKIEIITKFWIVRDWDWDFFDFSRSWLEQQLEDSLKRLKTDYVDIYMLHIPDENMDILDIVNTLNYLKWTWKIKSYGLCNIQWDLLDKFLNIENNQIDYIEDFYNLININLWNDIINKIWWKKEFLVYSPFYRGYLFDDVGIDDLLKRDDKALSRLLKHDWLKGIIKRRESLKMIAKSKWLKLEELALDFLLNNKNVNWIIFWTSNIKKLEYFMKLLELRD